MQRRTDTGRAAAVDGNLTIRAMTADDAEAVLEIYRDGIETGHATFSDTAPSWRSWDAGHLSQARLVALLAGRLVGWVAFAGTSPRPVYRGVAEISVYIARAARGRGVGRALMAAGIEASEAAGLWSLQAGIFPENEASLALHAASGFVVVGTRRRLGRMTYGPMRGRWRDVVLMERRSETVGTE